jgi:hypothetical protein
MKTRLAALFFTIAVPLLARGTEPQEQVALRQIEATRAAKWDDYTACMHPLALAKFKASMTPVADAAVASGTTPAKNILERVFANQDLEKLKGLPPAEFFKTFMQNWAARNPVFVKTMKNSSVEMIGHVMEGRNRAYVVFRKGVEAGGAKVTTIDVVSVEKDGNEWRCLLSDEMENLATSLLRQIKASDAAKPKPEPPAPPKPATPKPAPAPK